MLNGDYDCNWQLEINSEQSIISSYQYNIKYYVVFNPFKTWNGPDPLWNAISDAMELNDGRS